MRPESDEAESDGTAPGNARGRQRGECDQVDDDGVELRVDPLLGAVEQRALMDSSVCSLDARSALTVVKVSSIQAGS
jgi:hypothetical protein